MLDDMEYYHCLEILGLLWTDNQTISNTVVVDNAIDQFSSGILSGGSSLIIDAIAY